MADDAKEKEIVFRLAQSLAQSVMNEIKAQSIAGMKAGVDIRPYARTYNLLRERILCLGIKDSDKFIPELPEELLTAGITHDLLRNASLFDQFNAPLTQMVTFLNVNQENSDRILTELEEFLYKNLRKSVIRKPTDEKQIQDTIEIMLISKGYSYQREKVRIPYSSKEFIPDFTFEDLNALLEVKFCKTDEKEKDLVDEINADIPAYATKYENLTFLVYDMGIIRDTESFSKDIEKNSPRIKVLIIKQ
jgi:hypothetical protein